MFDGIQEFFPLGINFAVLPAACSDRKGEPIGLIIALIQHPIRMTGKTAFFQGFCLQSYLDGLKMEAFNAPHVSFDLTHTRLPHRIDRKSTRLNSSHLGISYAVFCLKKKKKIYNE